MLIYNTNQNGFENNQSRSNGSTYAFALELKKNIRYLRILSVLADNGSKDPQIQVTTIPTRLILNSIRVANKMSRAWWWNDHNIHNCQEIKSI
jgi:hypothetical protein